MSLLDSISPYAWADVTQNAVGPLADVSQSSPPMTSGTPTGTGTGEWTQWQQYLADISKTALNYAIARDQQQIAADTNKNLAYNAAAVQQANAGYQYQAANSNRLLLWGAMAIGVVFLVTRK